MNWCRQMYSNPDYSVKLALAQERCVELQQEVAAYWAAEPFELEHDIHPATHQELSALSGVDGPPDYPFTADRSDLTAYVLRFRYEREPDLQKWSVVVGEIVHNLRSALDNLIYSLAVEASGQDPPPGANQLQFPICKTEESYKQQLAKGRVAPLDISTQTLVKELQPFASVANWGLAVVQHLNNSDKHRKLTVHAVRPASYSMSTVTMEGGYSPPSWVNLGTIAPGDWISTTLSPQPVDLSTYAVELYVAVEGVPWPDGQTTHVELFELLGRIGLDIEVGVLKLGGVVLAYPRES